MAGKEEILKTQRKALIQADAKQSHKAAGLQSGSFEPACRPDFALFESSVPVMLFAAIQRSNPVHFFRCQFKAEQVKILPDMIRVG